MIKYDKKYRLTIQLDDDALIIELPFTVQFDITRNTMAQANTGNFQIYNLKSSTRSKIFQDLFDISSRRTVVFEAGYGDTLNTIFVGTLRTAYSHRQSTEVITEMHCFDDGQGDMMNSFTNQTVSSGFTKKDLINGLMSNMKNTLTGEVGDFGNIPNSRGASLVGNTFTILNKYTNGNVYIDNSQIMALKPNEVIEGLVPLIDSSTGLLGTPQRQDSKLTIETIFEPRILVGQVIEVNSTIQPEFNGQFKVIGINHSGIISNNVSSEARTRLELFIPNILNNQTLGLAQGNTFNLVKNGKISPVLYGKVDKNIRAVYAYLLKYGKPPALNITKNISWKQALLNYSSQGSTPSIQVIANLVRTAETIQSFVDTYFPGKKIQINSGWRSKSYNASIRGSSATSKHIQGLAMDFVILGVSISKQHQYARQYMVGEIITYSWGQHYGLQSNKEVRNSDR